MQQWLEPSILMALVLLLVRAVYLLGSIANQFKTLIEVQKKHGEDIEELKTDHAELKGIVHASLQ